MPDIDDEAVQTQAIDASGGTATATRVFGDGMFVEVGEPSAVATSDDVVVIGGSHGWAQNNVRTALKRSAGTVGWYPIGVYDAGTLTCRRVFTSRWTVNSIAIHPSGDLVAIGTGSYDGGYSFEGELLVHNLVTGMTVSVLDHNRCVEALRWVDDTSLELLLAPPTDEDVDNHEDLVYFLPVVKTDWKKVGPRSVQIPTNSTTSRPVRDTRTARREVADLAGAHGQEWRPRRQAWSVTPCPDGGFVVGLSSAIERWNAHDGALRWRTAFEGTCTQVMPGQGSLQVAVWADGNAYQDRATTLTAVSVDTGVGTTLVQPGHGAAITARSDGNLLIRDTRHTRREPEPAVVLNPAGTEVGRVDLGGYDLFNHHLDIRKAQDFLVLVGEPTRPWDDKHVAAVTESSTGDWTVNRLFPLAWTPGAHLFGGPGAFVDDPGGLGLIHSGVVHDGRGLLPGNAFVARRSYPDGELLWHVPLDNQITGLDEHDGRTIAVTNLGELLTIDTLTGQPLARRNGLSTRDGHPVVPLTLVITSEETMLVGTFDGRVAEYAIPLR
ncbi:hypothetical protein L1785_13820 [Antribacter sp. KLBMP9083]|uniref:Uncharacterized protein n=1 Tax=Antribacter soli TaxID=2910976 RepID=A0AA41U7X1_9MICO|nr:hypothetical protein [Antribacter soli]MCF4122056.1 hypothetical protein [Antribacter soli]